MEASHPPFIDSTTHLAAVQDLHPDDRALLAFILEAPGSLADLAAKARGNIVHLIERLLDPQFQAALEAVAFAAQQFARLRALLEAPIATATLADIAIPTSSEVTPNPAERRRAATTLMRAAPKNITTPSPAATTRHTAGARAVVTDNTAPDTSTSPSTPTPPDPTPTSTIPNPTSDIPNAPDPVPTSAIPNPTSHIPTRSRDRPLAA